MQRKRKFLAFGTEEKILSADLVYHPLVFVEAKYVGGLLLKSPKISSFVIDGVNANLINISKGLKTEAGFSELLGLTSDSIQVLSKLDKKGMTRIELEARTKLSTHAVRDAIKFLREKKLVTDKGKIKQHKLYIPLTKTKFPKLSSLQQKLELNFENVKGKQKQRKIVENDLRMVLKGIEPSAEIIKFQVFYYPVWEACLSSEKGPRTLNLDAVTGNEIPKLN